MREARFRIIEKYWREAHEARRRHGRIILHRSLVASLSLVLACSFMARHIVLESHFDAEEVQKSLELLKLESIRMQPPPEKQVAVLPPPSPDRPEPVPEVIRSPIKPVRQPRRPHVIQTQEEPELRLAVDMDVDIPAQSGLPDLARQRTSREIEDFEDRRLDFADTAVVMGPELATTGDLVLDAVQRNGKRKSENVNPDLDLSGPAERAPSANQNEHALDESLLDVDVTLQLASNDVSMGAEEYKLWNRINAEFDRWDKGRYGSLPSSLRRKGRAIVAEFLFENGLAHRVVWLRGNTRIYVLGRMTHDRMAELKRALNALIHLNVD